MTAEADFRAWVRSELAARLAPRRADRPVSVLGAGNDDLDAGRRYLEALAGTGLAVPSWPREYGGLGATPAEVAIVRRELADFAVPDLYPYLVGLELVGPTLLAHGTPEQCARWLPPIATGEEIWCQLFSEPGAGSDLAGLVDPRATPTATSGACTARRCGRAAARTRSYGLLLARHDPAVPEAPGHHRVRARPAHARRRRAAAAPDERRRALHRGVPRRRAASPTPIASAPSATAGASRSRACRSSAARRPPDRAAACSTSTASSRSRRRAACASEPGRPRRARPARHRAARDGAHDPRAARDTARTGQPGPEGSGLKLRGSRTFRDYTNLALRDPRRRRARPHGEPWHTLFLTAPSLSIRGGTDEIQRNIVGERVLGLPEEPRLDRTLPFDELPR